MQILGGYRKYNISSSCSRFIVEVTPFIIQYLFNMHESNGWCIEFMLIHLCHARCLLKSMNEVKLPGRSLIFLRLTGAVKNNANFWAVKSSLVSLPINLTFLKKL